MPGGRASVALLESGHPIATESATVAAEAFRTNWERFCAAERFLGPTPGHREAWAAGRGTYAVWAVRVEAEAVRRRVAAIQHTLPEGLRRIPRVDLHVTVWVGGFPTQGVPGRDDDIREEDLARQARDLAGCRGFRLQVGSANSFTTAPFLEVFDPDGGLAAVRSVLARGGPPELRFAPFLPHLTLATADRDVPVARVRPVLLPHRQLPMLEVGVRQIAQIRFDAVRPGAPLRTHCTVDLR